SGARSAGRTGARETQVGKMKVEADLDAKGPEPEGRPISTFRTVGNSETTGLESIGDKSPYHSPSLCHSSVQTERLTICSLTRPKRSGGEHGAPANNRSLVRIANRHMPRSFQLPGSCHSRKCTTASHQDHQFISCAVPGCNKGGLPIKPVGSIPNLFRESRRLRRSTTDRHAE